MVSFLNPALLWALPAAFLPVLIHLLSLRRARRIPFSDLTMLRAAYRKSLPAARLRQWLLLALRCLALAALVAAFARPILHSGGRSGAPEAGVDAVLLLDASYSMGYRLAGRPRLEAARAAGQALLRSLGSQDRAAVAVFSDRAEGTGASGAIEWSRDAASAADALGRFKPTWRTTDYLPPLQAAYSFLRQRGSPSRRKVVALLSDGAAHGWKVSEAARPAAEDPSVLLVGLSWADRPENAALEEVRRPPEDHGAPGVSFRTRLQGAARPGWDAELWLGGARTARRSLDLPPGSSPLQEWALPPDGPAARWGKLALRPDALSVDDEHHFSMRTEPRSRVLLIHGGPRSFETGRGGHFLRKLLADDSSQDSFRLEVADSVRWRSLDLKDFKAVVAADFRSVPEELGQALARYVRAGGGLWVLPAEPDGPESFRPLAPLLPGRVGSLRAYGGRGLGVKVEPAAISEAAGEGARPFSWEDFDLQNVTLRRAFEIEPVSEARVWLRDPGGSPLLLSRDVGEGRVLLWAGSWDVGWTNLALKPVFVALVERGLAWLSRRAGRAQWRTSPVGRQVERTWKVDEAAPATVRLRGPEGRAVTLQVVGRRVGFVPDAPGFWRLEGASRAEPEEVYAAHLDRSTGESDLTPAPDPPWRPIRVDHLEEDFQQVLYGKEARTGVLAMVLVLLALETFLANPRRKES